MPKTPFLSPGTVQGFLSARAPSALPKGAVSLIENARLDDGTVRARWGALLILAAVFGAYGFRGCFECVQNGVPTIFWAGRSGGRTTVLKTVNGGAAWTEITPSSGTYGDTRFPSEGYVRFALVNDGGADLVVMQNGADDPRVYSGTVAAVSSAITARVGGTAQAGFPSVARLDLATTVANSNASKIAGTLVTDAKGSYAQVVVHPVAQAGATSSFSVVAPTLLMSTTGRDGQFVWFVDAAGEGWRSLKIEIQDEGAAWYTMYDPATDPIVTANAETGTAVLAGAYTLSRSPDSTQPLKGITAVRFSWVGDPPAADTTVKIYLLAAGGHVAGGTQYALAYASPDARAVGPSTLLPVVGLKPYGLAVPVSPLFLYSYASTFTTPATLAAGVTQVNAYRQDLGATGYYRWASRAVAPSTAYTIRDGDSDVLIPTDYTRPMLRPDAVALPKGTAMESVNGRLFVAAGSRLYYSEAGRPFSFALTVQFDASGSPVDTSAGSFSKPGETFQAVVGVGQIATGTSVGTPLTGAVTVYAITDRLTYALSGWDAASLNRSTPICVGTRSPFSVGRASGSFFMLDSERQVRKVQGSSSVALSKQAVDDVTLAIPDAALPTCWGAFHDGRYRLSFGTGVLVYSEPLSGFESVDRYASPLVALLPWYDASLSRVRVMGFGSTSCVETEVPNQQTDPGSAPVALRVVFPEIGFGTAAAKVAGASFVADVDPSGTATYALLLTTGTRLGLLTDSPVSLAPRKAGETRVVARTKTGFGADSLSAQPSLSLSCKGGTRLYHLALDVSQGPDITTA